MGSDPGVILHPMRERSLKAFLLTAALLALPAVVGLWRMGRFGFHLAVNGYHTPFLDGFFPFFTELANGWVPVVLSLLLLLKSWRTFLMMGLATGLSALVVQSLKRLVFEGEDRPSMFLGQMPGLHLVAGVDLHHYYSFPSGHSTAAFSMCLALAVITGKRIPAVLLACMAALLAYSRVYLSQHFTEDILAGMAVGCITATMVYLLLYRSPWGARPQLDRSPLRRYTI